MWKVEYTKRFLRELSQLPKGIQAQAEDIVFSGSGFGVTHLKAPVKRKKYSYRKRSIFFPFRRSYRSGRNKSIESSPSFPLP